MSQRPIKASRIINTKYKKFSIANINFVGTTTPESHEHSEGDKKNDDVGTMKPTEKVHEADEFAAIEILCMHDEFVLNILINNKPCFYVPYMLGQII